MSVSVKRKPVFCGACSMDITNTVRIRCAQLGPVQTGATSATTAAGRGSHAGDSSISNGQTSSKPAHGDSGLTKKHDSLDSLPTGPRTDGLVPTCDEFDICGSCYCEGKEVGRHKRWHDYRVVTQHAYPIFTDDWGADEELLLISACQTFGLGNWADIAEHIGSYRTKEEVEAHYLSTYIDSPEYPLPNLDVKLIDQDTFQARKKQRLEEAKFRPVPIAPPKPLASAPTCHEIAGFMPGRLEFETEWENDAEMLIKDMEFGLVRRYAGEEQPTREEAMAADESSRDGLATDSTARENRQPQTTAPSGRGLGSSGDGQANGHGEGTSDAATANADAKGDTNGVASANQTGEKGKDGDGETGKDESAIAVWEEGDDDLELKLTMHEIYNERIERRLDAKNLIFDRGLLDYKKIVAVEKKRPKEERDLLNRIKVFSKIQTAQDHEEFANGLLYEAILRKHASDLQDYREAGLTSFSEVEKYEKDKAARGALKGSNNFRDAFLLARSSNLGRSTGGSAAASREGTPRPPGTSSSSTAPARKLPTPQLTFSNSASLQLLSATETKLCAELRILPRPYLFIKQALLREFARCGGKLEKERAIDLLEKVDPRVVVRVWEELFGVIEELVEELMNDDDDDDDEQSDDDDDEDDEESSSEDEGDLMGELQALQEQQQAEAMEIAT